MKALFVLLVLSTLAVLAATIAMWWRLRRHLHQPDDALKSDEELKKVLQEIENKPERDPVER